ncbi:MAG: PQQ-binding-like beta-propeller repeat protein [Acidimicrobiia bacterium]
MARLALVLALGLVVAACTPSGETGTTTTANAGPTDTTTTSTTQPTPTDSTEAPATDWPPSVDRSAVGQPWGDAVAGLLTFRGNPSNTFWGTGPIPDDPAVVWQYPDEPMCGPSTDLGVTSTWCGNGWTGQPAIWERADGVTELMVGAYDHRFHFVDTATGEPTRTPLQTGDIVKGSPTIDPDGFPLVYFGSRDDKLRIVALDRGDPEVLWDVELCLPEGAVSATDPKDCPPAGDRVFVEGRWNNDWDAAPRIVDDILYASAENSFFYIWKLNRAYDANGRVTVDPELLVRVPTWDDELLEKITDGCEVGIRCGSTSAESTPVFFEDRVYFGTSAGRVMGLDISDVEAGEAPIVFDYWVGDDVDASIVVDADGMLYVPVEWKRYLPRGRELGQLVKLDPYADGDPYVWGMFSITEPPAQGGLWATPAFGDGVLYVATNKGFLVAVDQDTGEELWVTPIGARAWSSPVVVDDVLLVAGRDGLLRAFDLAEPRAPEPLWELEVGEAPILATPAVWEGRIYLPSTDGFFYAVDERS